MLSNNMAFDTKVTIIFNQESRNQVNYRLPCTEFSQVIPANKRLLPLVFSKVYLGAEWGDIMNIRVIVDGCDIMTEQEWNRNARDFPELY